MGCIVSGWDGAGYLDSFTEGIPLSFELGFREKREVPR
jgi:hypothetical protein